MKFVLVLVLLACAMSLSLKERMQTAALESAEVKATATVETSTNCPDGFVSFCSGSDCAGCIRAYDDD